MALGAVIGEGFVDIRPAFDKFAGELSTGVNKATTEASAEGSKHFQGLATVGKAAFLGIAGAASVFAGAAVKAALEGEQSTAQLSRAVRNAGDDYDALEPSISKVTDGFAKFGYENDQAEAALTRLVDITGDTRGSLDLLTTAADLAAARHIDLTAAANLVGRAAEGNVAPLKRLGIQVEDTGSKAGNAQAAIDALNQKFGGAAQAQADTYAGKMAAFKATLSNLTEEVGVKLIPVLAGLAGGAAAAIDFFEHNRAAAIALAVAVGGPLVAAMAAYVIQQGIVVKSKMADFLETVGIKALYATEALRIQVAAMGAFGVTTLAVGLAVSAGSLFLLNKMTEDARAAAAAAQTAGQAYADSFIREIEQAPDKVQLLRDRIGELTEKQYVHGSQTYKDAEAVTALTEQLNRWTAGTEGARDANEALGQSTDDLAPSLDNVAEKYGLTIATVNSLASSLKISADMSDEQAAALDAAAGRLAVTSSSTLTLQDAIAKLGDQTVDATAKAQAFNTALDLLIGGNIDAERAVVNFQASVDGLGQKLRDNKLSFDAHTQAGRENITMVQSAVENARNHIEALNRQGASADALRGALAGDTQALRDQLTAAGLTKVQIDQLINSYGLVPSSINTIINADASRAAAVLAEIRHQFEVLASTFNAPLRVFATPQAGGGGTVTVRRFARGEYWPGGRPELAIVGDSREVMLPLDDPRRMAEILAKAGVGGGGTSSAAVPIGGPSVQVDVSISMPGLATAPEARRMLEEVARGEFSAGVTRALEAAAAGAGSRGV